MFFKKIWNLYFGHLPKPKALAEQGLSQIFYNLSKKWWKNFDSFNLSELDRLFQRILLFAGLEGKTKLKNLLKNMTNLEGSIQFIGVTETWKTKKVP